ncbi:MAG: hypothetical protein HY644_14655, partial [Acidobacteria bacterium]|nr:hypothetical protein [Acidobacteriota bacterium]
MQIFNEKLRGSRRSERKVLWQPIAGLMVLLLLVGAAVAQNQTGEGPVDFVTTGGNFDYTKTATTGDPVSAGNGAYQLRLPLLSLGGPMDLGFELIYQSNFNQNSPARIPV